MKGDDFKPAEKEKTKGNNFLLGYDLHDLYYNAFVVPETPSGPKHVCLAWHLDDTLYITKENDELRNPDILLEVAGEDRLKRIFITRDLGKYVKNENGKLLTAIMYLHDKDCRIYDVKVKYAPVHSKAYDETQNREVIVQTTHKYAFDVEKLRHNFWPGKWLNSAIFYFEGLGGFTSTREHPQKPWHKL